MTIEARLYDWDEGIPGHNVGRKKLNEVWGQQYGEGEPIALEYRDGKFTGAISPVGGATLEDIQAVFQQRYEDELAAQERAAVQADTQEAINAKLDFLIMMEV